MTEDTGFESEPEDTAAEPQNDAEAAPEAEPAPDAEAPAEPAEPVTPLPDESADPQQVADEAAAAEPADPPAPPVADPDWLLDVRTQQPGSAILAAIEDLYRRLRNLGG